MPHRRDAGHHHIINKYISGLKEIKVRGRLCRVADAPAAEQLIDGGREVGWQVWQSLCSNRTPAAAQQRVSQQHRDEGSQAKPKTKNELLLVCKEAAENVTRKEFSTKPILDPIIYHLWTKTCDTIGKGFQETTNGSRTRRSLLHVGRK